MRSLLVKNTSESIFISGTASIYDQNRMAGQTCLTPLNKNDEMLICYSIDMSASVTRNVTSNKEKIMRI